MNNVIEGLTIGAGYASAGNTNTSTTSKDTKESVANVVYSAGPVSVGYRMAESNAGGAGTASRAIDHYSIAFNVNDNLSLSYADAEDTYDAQADASADIADVSMDMTSIQAAYSMGAMSIKAYTTEITNPNFDEDAATVTKNEIALGLSF